MAVLNPEDCVAQRSPARLIRRLSKTMTALVESRFDGRDLSFPQWIALKAVRDGLVRNAGELARELGITTGATTRLIDGLEERGLLCRDRACADRRVVQLAVTEEGRSAVAELMGHVVGAWNDVVADIDQAEVEAMAATARKMLEAAERLFCANDASAANRESLL
ncbi:MAG TPA: MarR family transcriptional regulator [Sphingomonas sp.]|nr:MarR family transcriptional regulator [Sphingomonas sp.]